MLGISCDKILSEISEWDQLFTSLHSEHTKELQKVLTKYNFHHPSEIAQAYPEHAEIERLASSVNAYHQILQAGIPAIQRGLKLLSGHFQNKQNPDLEHLDNAFKLEIFLPLKVLARQICVLTKQQKDNNQVKYKYEIAVTKAEKKVKALGSTKDSKTETANKTVEESHPKEENLLLAQAEEELRQTNLQYASKIQFCKMVDEQYVAQLEKLQKESHLIGLNLLKVPALIMEYFETIFDCEDTFKNLIKYKGELENLARHLEIMPPPKIKEKSSEDWDKDLEGEISKPGILALVKQSRTISSHENPLVLSEGSSFNSADWGSDSEHMSKSTEDLEAALAQTLNIDSAKEGSSANNVVVLSPTPSYLPQLNTTITTPSLPTGTAVKQEHPDEQKKQVIPTQFGY